MAQATYACYLEFRMPPTDPPRFGVAHLVLWVGCTAVYMAIVRSQFQGVPGLLGMLIVCCLSMIWGAAWACLAIFVTRRVRGVRWPIEPGEWLGAILGARLAIEVLLMTLLAGKLISNRALLDIITCCLLVVPLLGRSLKPRWRSCFYLLLIITPLSLLGTDIPLLGVRWIKPELFSRWATVVPLLLIVVPAIFAAIDQRGGMQHTWLQWAGLVTWLLVQVVEIGVLSFVSF